jgi:hypothetical protein
MALCNNYLSYAKEKNESAGNGLSTVEFVMQEKMISEEAALESLKARIAEEETYQAAFEERLKDKQRLVELRRYIAAMRFAAAGWHLFHSTALRYHQESRMTSCSSNKRTTTCIAVGIVVLLWLLYLEGGLTLVSQAEVFNSKFVFLLLSTLGKSRCRRIATRAFRTN